MNRNWRRRNDWLRVRTQILLVLLFSALPVTVSADAYKWVDEGGRVHYSDSQPPDAECEKIEIKQERNDNCTDIAERKRRLDEAEKAADRRIDERRKRLAAVQAGREAHLAKQEKCFDARKQLVVLQMQMPVYRDMDGNIRAAWKYDTYKGEREYLDDAARTAEIANTKKLITTLCQHPDDTVARANARKQWLRSERCAAARSDLEALQRPQSKSSDQAIEDKRQEVDRYCNDE
jgi:hypothetical protein